MPTGGEFAPVLLNPNEFLVPLGFLPFPNVLHPYIAAFAVRLFPVVHAFQYHSPFLVGSILLW
jgi:hypothetical protein